MLRQYLLKLYSNAVAAIASAMSLLGALVRCKELWFDSKLAPVMKRNPLNAILTMSVIVLGLLAILITPALSFLLLGVIAFLISFDRKATTKFVMMGGLSTTLGALTIVDLPISPITSMRIGGPQFATNFFAILCPYTIFGIAAIGLLSLALQIELTPGQRETLTTLVSLHHQGNLATKSKEIADLIKRHPGTIRNQMQSLKVLSLVESVTGPRGGYKATDAAFEVLGLDNNGNGSELAIPVVRNATAVEDVSASEIIFNKVTNPYQQRNGQIRIIGNIRKFDIGDEIEVGPIPFNNLYIRGKLMDRDYILNRLILDVEEIISIPKISIGKVARRAVRISADATLQDASKILIKNGVREALVETKPPGLINTLDVARAVADGKTNLKIEDVITYGFMTINSDEFIVDAINILNKTGANQLVVMEKGEPWGFVTSYDLIKSLASNNHGAIGLS